MITDISKHKETKDQTTITALRNRCETNSVFNSMCHVFAIRERTRRQITLSSLQTAMMKEGFKFTKLQLAEELRFLASVGIGKLILNKKGIVTSLDNVSVTLQSIGLAAVNRLGLLKKFHPTAITTRDLFSKSAASFDKALTPKPLPKLLEKKSPPVAKPDDFQAYLTLVIDEKIMQFDLLPEFSTKELFNLMAKAMKGVK